MSNIPKAVSVPRILLIKITLSSKSFSPTLFSSFFAVFFPLFDDFGMCFPIKIVNWDVFYDLR
jgi:hypothetical protein